MQLSPRYDGPPVLTFEGPVADLAVPLLRQRRRLAETLAGFDADQWAAPTRCEEWTVRDVVSHLVTTNHFWAASIAAGRGGHPTRMLEGFDPVATPAQLVDAAREQPAATVLADFTSSIDALAASVAGTTAATWDELAEAPPGHLPLQGVVRHALWDAWTHERDILLPLGMAPVEEPDEIAESLRYAAAVAPALLAAAGSTRQGTLFVHATDPDVRFVVEVASSVVVRDADLAPAHAARLTGQAVDLVEGLTFRTPLTHEVPPEHEWLLRGLADAFDRPV